MIIADPTQLQWLILLPIVSGIFWFGTKLKHKKMSLFYSHTTFTLNSYKKELILVIFVILALILAKTQPQYGQKWTHTYKSSMDIVIALDLSTSMLATDTQPNRLSRAKQEVQLLLQKLTAHRVALIGFTETAFTHVPLTTDHSIVSLFLDELDPGFNSSSGTGFSDLMIKSSYLLRESAKNERVLIILSDGELSNESIDDSVKLAKKNNLKIITIGIGTTKGSPIPIQKNNSQVFLKDTNNQIVISKFNPKSLETLSKESNGTFLESSDEQLVSSKVYKLIKNYEQNDFKEKQRQNQVPRYHTLVIIATILLILTLRNQFTKKHPRLRNSND